MKLSAILMTLFVGVLSLAANAQQTKLLTADKHNEYGLVYSLPTTALDIEVEVLHTVKKAGPYGKYAKKYLGISEVIDSNSEKWEVKSVRVTRRGVANLEEQYLMQFKAGVLVSICVAEDGKLLAVNSTAQVPSQTEIETVAMLPSSLDNNEYLQYVDEDFLVSQSSAKRAQMLAENIMEVRNAKIALSRGTAESMPTDGKQLELMLASLAHQEQTMTEAFVGTVQTETQVKKFTFTPSGDKNSDRQVLLRLSDFAGFVDADDYSGDPIYISVDVTRRGQMPVNEKGDEKKIPKDAVVYNIPGAAKVKLSTMTKTLFEQEMDFSQFGTKFGLNPSIFSAKKDPSYAIFDPITGALVEVGTVETEE